MTTTAMTPFHPTSLEQAYRLAEHLADSSLMPESLRGKPADIFVTLVTGHELGLSPMQAVRGIHVVKGKPVVSADLMVALVSRQSEVCVYFRLVESTDTKATYATLRAGHPEPTTMTWTIEQAQKAGLTSNANWKNHPAAMLRARCSAALARAVFPDLVLGVYEHGEGEEIRRDERPEPRVVLPETTAPIRHPKQHDSIPDSRAAAGVIDVPSEDIPPHTDGEASVMTEDEKIAITVKERLDADYEKRIAACKTAAEAKAIGVQAIEQDGYEKNDPIVEMARRRYNSLSKRAA